MADFEQLKMVTGPVRVTWMNVWAPRPPDKDKPAAKEKYDLCAIVDKNTPEGIETLSKIKAIVNILKAEAIQKYGKIPASFKFPLKDGDVAKEDDPDFEGKIFFNCSSTRKPGVIDMNGDEIPAFDKARVYNGCYCRLAINLFSYDAGGGKGIGIGLQAVMFVEDGDPIETQNNDPAAAFGIIKAPGASAAPKNTGSFLD